MAGPKAKNGLDMTHFNNCMQLIDLKDKPHKVKPMRDLMTLDMNWAIFEVLAKKKINEWKVTDRLFWNDVFEHYMDEQKKKDPNAWITKNDYKNDKSNFVSSAFTSMVNKKDKPCKETPFRNLISGLMAKLLDAKNSSNNPVGKEKKQQLMGSLYNCYNYLKENDGTWKLRIRLPKKLLKAFPGAHDDTSNPTLMEDISDSEQDDDNEFDPTEEVASVPFGNLTTYKSRIKALTDEIMNLENQIVYHQNLTENLKSKLVAKKQEKVDLEFQQHQEDINLDLVQFTRKVIPDPEEFEASYDELKRMIATLVSQKVKFEDITASIVENTQMSPKKIDEIETLLTQKPIAKHVPSSAPTCINPATNFAQTFADEDEDSEGQCSDNELVDLTEEPDIVPKVAAAGSVMESLGTFGNHVYLVPKIPSEDNGQHKGTHEDSENDDVEESQAGLFEEREEDSEHDDFEESQGGLPEGTEEVSEDDDVEESQIGVTSSSAKEPEGPAVVARTELKEKVVPEAPTSPSSSTRPVVEVRASVTNVGENDKNTLEKSQSKSKKTTEVMILDSGSFVGKDKSAPIVAKPKTGPIVGAKKPVPTLINVNIVDRGTSTKPKAAGPVAKDPSKALPRSSSGTLATSRESAGTIDATHRSSGRTSIAANRSSGGTSNAATRSRGGTSSAASRSGFGNAASSLKTRSSSAAPSSKSLSSKGPTSTKSRTNKRSTDDDDVTIITPAPKKHKQMKIQDALKGFLTSAAEED